MAVLQGQTLDITSCEPISREDLKKRLRRLPANAVAGMDFPFGVPHQFALELYRESNSMPHIWRICQEIEYNEFLNRRDGFVAQYGELTRGVDNNLEGPISPLKTGGPNMLPMTFRGMEMLNDLWHDEHVRFRVPPLPEGERNGPTLLETMPGVVLRVFELPYQNYKGAKSNPDSRKNRDRILAGLRVCSYLTLNVPNDLEGKCVDYHDGLDSLVAAFCAALWVDQEIPFRIPAANWLIAAQLEGWIYAPQR